MAGGFQNVFFVPFDGRSKQKQCAALKRNLEKAKQNYFCENRIGRGIGREPCGQSYKSSTIVNYESRVILWGNFKSGTTLEL